MFQHTFIHRIPALNLRQGHRISDSSTVFSHHRHPVLAPITGFVFCSSRSLWEESIIFLDERLMWFSPMRSNHADEIQPLVHLGKQGKFIAVASRHRRWIMITVHPAILLAMAEKLKITKLKTGKDRISSLPEQAMNKILGSLPIRDAISTSFLSKGWRYKWRSMSDLIFHSDSFSSSKEWEPSSFTRIYLSKVHRTLFLHRGDIRKFKFHSSGSEVINSEVDIWLDYLVVASVQQLVLAFTKEYLIHSAAFRFDKLITLDLKFCKITLPASFDGFKLLTTLRLRFITFENANTLETLINLCPLLEVFYTRILLGCPQRLILHAPNLWFLTIVGSLSYLEFKETRMMTYVELMLNPSEFLYDFTNILSSLSNVDYLSFWSSENRKSVLKEVVFSPLMIENVTFNKLKTLHLGVNLNCSKETSIVFCILKNCPSLTYLEIFCEHLEEDGTSLSTSDEFWNDQSNFSSSFDNLKDFYITNVHGSKSELRFIKYILGKAPLLEVSNIKIDWSTIAFGERKMGDILIQLLSFERISSAQVIIDR